MAEGGELLPTLGGRTLTEDHAALWLAVMETGAGRVKLLRAMDAAMCASHDARDYGHAQTHNPAQTLVKSEPGEELLSWGLKEDLDRGVVQTQNPAQILVKSEPGEEPQILGWDLREDLHWSAWNLPCEATSQRCHQGQCVCKV